MKGFAFVTASLVALLGVQAELVEVSELFAFAEKDGIVFEREGFGENGPSPVDLVLKREGVFFAVEGNTLEGSPVTTLEWNIKLNNGDPIELPSVEVAADRSFVLNTNLTENLFEFGNRGDNVAVVTITSPQDESVDFVLTKTIYTISGFETVIPLLALIVLALLSRNVYIAMFFGTWLGSFIIEGGDIALSFKNLFDVHVIPSVTAEENFRTVTFTLFLSGFISMIKRAGGQDGFSNAIGKFATSAKKTQLAAVMAGVGLFFDDYSSVLILGSSFKKLTDRFYVSREKLAFVADATSAPIASIAPISSWIAFELSRIKPELDAIKSGSQFSSKDELESEYPFFLSTIKSRYYPFFMLTVQILLIAAGIEFGPMLYAERKTRLAKRTDGGDGRMEIPMEQDYTNPADDTPRRAWNFFIPIGFFIGSLLLSLVNIGLENIDAQNELLGEDEQIRKILREIFGATDSFSALVYTTMGASLFALVFFTFQMKKDGKIACPDRASLCRAIDCRLKNTEDVALQEGIELNPGKDPDHKRPIMYFTEGVNIWVEGFKNLVPAILILCMAFTIKSIVTGLGTDRFFTDLILNAEISAGALPTIIFVVSGLLALATGTSFGTMSIMFPLVSTATFEKSGGDVQLFTVALSSIMAGAVFGDHSSLISDTTILASIGSGCQIGAHVYTQMPYAVWAAMFAVVFGTLPAGYGADPTVMLIIGIVAITIVTLLVSAPIVAVDGRLDFFSEMILKCTKSSKLQSFKTRTRVFAAENPELINREPWDFLFSNIWCLRKCGEAVQARVPFLRPPSKGDGGLEDHYVKDSKNDTNLGSAQHEVVEV